MTLYSAMRRNIIEMSTWVLRDCRNYLSSASNGV